MTGKDRIALVRECYDAYATGERRVYDESLSEDFRFSSPVDVGLDRAGYFERCWPNAGSIQGYEFVRLTEIDDEQVLVTYEATKADGRRFRNTEIFTFGGEMIRSVEVYFGWDL